MFVLLVPFLGCSQPVEVAPVTRGPIAEFVEERGESRLPQTHLITMPFEGRVAAIALQEGDSVEVGQEVARIVQSDMDIRLAVAQARVARLEAEISENNDTTIEQSTLAQSQELVTSTKATYDAAVHQMIAARAKQVFAKKRFQRNKELIRRDALSEEALEEAELKATEAVVEEKQADLLRAAIQSMYTAIKIVPEIVQQQMTIRKPLHASVLQQQKQEALADLRQVQIDLKRSVMKTSVNGVVLKRKETNERRLTAGTVLLEIGQPELLEFEADFLTQDVISVKPGDPAQLYGPVIGSDPLPATVARIYPAGFTKVSSLGVEEQRVKVIVRLESEVLQELLSRSSLGVGYRVLIRIFTASKPDALVVPRSSLFRNSTGQWQCFVVRDGQAQRQTVSVGLMNDQQVEIVAGLNKDDKVVLAPETSLSDGTPVQPQQRPPSTRVRQPLPPSLQPAQSRAAQSRAAQSRK